MSPNVLVYIILVLLRFSSAYRILVVYPTPAISHQKGQQIITQTLAEKGHEIVLISPFEPLEVHSNIHHINVSSLWKAKVSLQAMAERNLSLIEMYTNWRDVSCQMIELVMEHDTVHKLINNKSEHFDAVIVELLGLTTLHAFGPHFNASLIGLSSVEPMVMVYKERGNPTHPVLHPDVAFQLTERPNFLERAKLFVIYIGSLVSHYWGLSTRYDEMTKRYFHTDLTSSELIRAVDFHIEEVSPVLMNVRPLLPHTVQIGFMHIQPPQPLPADLQEFMDEAERGVIYVSLGSTLSGTNIGYHMINIFKDVFATLNYSIIWKFESDSLKAKPANIKLMDWIPQTDLLAHPNLRLFITQGGLQSMEEFIARGVPAIAIPFFADQEHNARRIEELGVGKCLLKNDITRKRFSEAIHEVINDAAYKIRTQELYKQAMDRPMPPVEEAVWLIEYAIRNTGAKHLKYVGAEMPWHQWLLLDVISFYLLLIIVTFWIILKALQCFLCRKKK